MKKKILYGTIFIGMIVGIPFLFKGLNKGKGTVNEFIIMNNLDDTKTIGYDEVYTQVCSLDSSTFPFEENVIETLKQSDYVVDVMPVYRLMMLPKDNKMNIEYSVIADGKEIWVDTGPSVREYDGLIYPKEYYIQNYPDKDNLVNNIELTKEFDNDSGVFISQGMFKKMNVPKNCKELILNIDISVPHYAKKATIQYSDKDTCLPDDPCTEVDYPGYTIEEYAIVNVQLEVEGVYNDNSSGAIGSQICMSCKQAEEIFQMSLNAGENDPNRQLWQPTSYWIITSNKVQVEELGNDILQYMNNFILENYTRDFSYNNRKVFK